jgi:hypothetical protein
MTTFARPLERHQVITEVADHIVPVRNLETPAALYRRLKEQAAPSLARQRVKFPLIRSQGPKVPLSNEQIYERVAFP